MAEKRPTKKELTDAGRKLQGPRTPETQERKAAQTLRKAHKAK